MSELEEILKRDQILNSTTVAQRQKSFWDNSPMQAKALLLPNSTEDVSKVLSWCHENDQTVITHGGLTGCVSGADSTGRDVVLSLERMNRIVEIDAIDSLVVVEAGCILQTLQEQVASAGLYFPLDLGARGSCMIGGNIATNAGGINVLRYGMMRNLVLGIEAVLPDGTVISSMNRMLKNNAGYDVKQLFIGTEGTLGVVTKAILRLYPQPASRESVLVAFAGFAQICKFLGFVQKKLAGALSAYEVMWGDYYDAVTRPGGHRAPLDNHYPYYAVLQVERFDTNGSGSQFEQVLSSALEESLIVDAVIPKSSSEAEAIWNIRENFECLLSPAPVYMYDVSLPIREMARYVDSVKRQVGAKWSDGACYVFGHLADGNLHLFVRPNEDGEFRAESDDIVYGPLGAIGGSVSAEHGIGKEKRKWLSSSRTASEISLMRLLKHSVDPRNLLNRGIVLE